MDRAQLIQTLQHRIDEALQPYVPTREPLIVLDFPNHANVGDSAIYAGQLAFFKKRTQAAPSIVSDSAQVPWDDLAASSRDAPIFFCGGGNFGDLWPPHQEFREEVLARFPGRLVVQLPQSIHFNDPARLARTAEAIKRHGNFVLFVRDDASFELARKHFHCEVKRCPDMAFCLGPLERIGSPERELLLLLRQDKEKRREAAGDAAELPSGSLVADWLDDDKNMKTSVKSATMLDALLRLRTNKMALRCDYYDKLATSRLRRGIRLLSSSGFVITDRLHVHIVCALLDIPHVVLDNSYGKVSGFIGLWTEGFAKMRRADSIARALAVYRSGELI